MNRFISFALGTVHVQVTGLSAESFMNLMAAKHLRFWRLSEDAALTVSCTVFSKDEKKIQALLQAKGFEIVINKRKGLPQLLRLTARRPVFAAGFLICAFLLAVLPRFVWTVSIEGNETVDDEIIRRIMDDYGVHFGADGNKIDSQMLKNKALNDIPELKWCAVNQKGGCVTILVAERELVPPSEVDSAVTNVIADRDGVVTKTEIYGGFRRCRVGQAVKEGELLISGIETFEKSTQLTHAYGEIYALTKREISSQTPIVYEGKRYSGEKDTNYCLILGRKRINLFRNSGIPHGSCDKIIKRSQLVLPGDYAFPVWLEEETLLYYTPVFRELDKQAAQERLLAFSESSAEDKMIAGKILAEKHQIKRKNDCWVMSATYSCEEMIARTVPVQIEESETENGGKDH